MKNVVTLIVVIAIAIAVGVAVSVQMSNAGTNANSGSSMVGQQLAHIIEMLGKIDQRLNDMEKQNSKMQDIVEQVRNAAQRYAQAPNLGAAAQAPQPPAEDMNKVYDIPVENSPIRGNKNAKITIVKFSDIQCPFCQRFYTPIAEVLKAYPNDVRFMIKNFPLTFHPNALPAAKASLAANEQGKYWEMMDLLLTHGADLSENGYKEMAKKISLNVDKFTKDLKDNDAKYQAIIQKEIDLGSQVQVMGTPTFFLNGKKTIARDLNGFKAEIDKILQQK